MFAPAVLRFLHQRVGVVFFVWWTSEPQTHEKDNTNMLVKKTKNSRGKRNQNSGASGT
jgi:hypothetical protein